MLLFMMFNVAGCVSRTRRDVYEPKKFFFPVNHIVYDWAVFNGWRPIYRSGQKHSFLKIIRERFEVGTIICVCGIFDILLLPISTYAYLSYQWRPPLEFYINKNDLKGLEEALKSGIDFNDDDSSPHDSFLNRVLRSNNFEALKLVFTYGAKPTLFFADPCYSNPSIEQIEMILYALKHGDKELLRTPRSPIICDWTYYGLNNNVPLKPLTEIVTILLDSGCPVNTSKVHYEGNELRTALDIALLPKFFPKEDKTTFIELLKSHGALTYQEILKIHPEVSPLQTDGLDIDPIFQPVIDKLRLSRRAKFFILSTTCPGIKGPVLVIDEVGRKTIQVHHRKSPTEWNQKSEPFNIPEGYMRVVLTPHGTKVPSRLSGLPTRCFIIEKWFTLPAFEVYLEINPHNAHHIHSIVESGILSDLPEDALRQDTLNMDSEFVSVGRILRENFQFKANGNRRYSKYVSNAKKITEIHGFSGYWMVHRFGDNYKPMMAFDTHERHPDKIPPNEYIAPYPDEILALIYLNRHFDKMVNFFSPHGKNGTCYWNHSANNVGSDCFYEIYYGDEVSDDTLERFQRFLNDLLTTYPILPKGRKW
ncbi:MAG: hypothetical protein J6X55_03980 [Victivallales bacterium]|nr:hypothetical protein [Victivallales bacterium]